MMSHKNHAGVIKLGFGRALVGYALFGSAPAFAEMAASIAPVPVAPTSASAVMVIAFGGDRGTEVADGLRKGLSKAGVEVASAEESAGLSSESSASLLREFALAHGARQLVLGTVTREVAGWVVELAVLDAGTHQALTQRLTARSLPGLVLGIEQQAVELLTALTRQPGQSIRAAPGQVGPATAALASAPEVASGDPHLGPVPGTAPAAPAERPPPVLGAPAPGDSVARSSPQRLSARDRLLLQVQGGMGLSVRSFSYSDPIADANNRPLEEHKRLGLALPFAEAKWFPFDHYSTGPLSHVGIAARFARSLDGNTAAFGQDFATYEQELLVDGHLRFGLGEHQLTLIGGWGLHQLRIKGDDGLGGSALPGVGVLPDVSYNMVRFGVEGALRLSTRWDLDARFVMRLPKVGELVGELGSKSWFPGASVDGIDAQVASTFELVRGVGLRGGAQYKRYGYSMNVRADDAFENGSTTALAHAVAGGAVDSYWGLFLGGSYSFSRNQQGAQYARAY